MTAREIKITKAVLDYLHAADRGQRTQLQIHAGAFDNFEPPKPSVSELKSVLENCDQEEWIRGTPDRFKKMLWQITTLGEGVRPELAD
jgi:hypothetical protein